MKGDVWLTTGSIVSAETTGKKTDKKRIHAKQTTPGLRKHHMRPIHFCHIVHDFGIKYIGQENTEHL